MTTFTQQVIGLAIVGSTSMVGLGLIGPWHRAQANPAPLVAQVEPLKIVLHVSAVEGWEPALSNVGHLSSQYAGTEIRVVVDGTGVLIFHGENDLAAKIASLTTPHIRFLACHNALNEQQVPKTAVPSTMDFVPAGVVAIAELEREGFAYIKP